MCRRRPGIGDSVAKSLMLGQLARQLLGDALDQVVAEADAGQALLAVGDRVEDRRIGVVSVARLGFGIEQPPYVAGETIHQRYLDEDQRLLRHARMEEGKAAPSESSRFLRVAPRADGVHRLIGHEASPGEPPEARQSMRTKSRKATSNQAPSSGRRSSLSMRAFWSPLPSARSSARRSTTNFTPWGTPTNSRSSRTAGGSSDLISAVAAPCPSASARPRRRRRRAAGRSRGRGSAGGSGAGRQATARRYGLAELGGTGAPGDLATFAFQAGLDAALEPLACRRRADRAAAARRRPRGRPRAVSTKACAGVEACGGCAAAVVGEGRAMIRLCHGDSVTPVARMNGPSCHASRRHA